MAANHTKKFQPRSAISLAPPKLATDAFTDYLSRPYGNSCHHRFGLRGMDGGALHGARATGAARPYGTPARRAAHHHEHRGKFPRFSRRRGRLRVDGADAETGR